MPSKLTAHKLNGPAKDLVCQLLAEFARPTEVQVAVKVQNTRLQNLETSVGDLRANQLQLITVLREGKIISKKHAAALQTRLIGT